MASRLSSLRGGADSSSQAARKTSQEDTLMETEKLEDSSSLREATRKSSLGDSNPFDQSVEKDIQIAK